MPWIQNVSKVAVKTGAHKDSKNCMLIQIADPCAEFPVPFKKFAEIHQFNFLDVDVGEKDSGLLEFACTDQQAAKLVELLQRALDNNMDVVVHCNAGICRSGAVCEVGTVMGFVDTRSHRIPNILVKRKMLQQFYTSI